MGRRDAAQGGEGVKKPKPKPVSRQRRYQLKLNALGLCELGASHGPAEKGKIKCSACLEKQNPGRRRQDRDAWKTVDWSRTDAEIARTMGLTGTCIYLHRRKHGILNAWKARWLNVNWSQRDSVIAKSLGVSVQTVGYHRRKRAKKGKP